MGRILRVLVTLVFLCVLVIVGLSIFIRIYYTEVRLKSLIVPKAEEALGRKVELGEIKVGLFSGVRVRDFAIKEADGASDFLRGKEFILRYSLLPLLQRRLVIKDVRLEEPSIHIVRNEKGVFNFESLKFLSEKKQAGGVEHETGAKKVGSETLPFSLTVKRVRVDRAHVVIEDSLKELPYIDAKGNVNVAVGMGKEFPSLRFDGSADLVVKLIYGALELDIPGKFKFSNDKVGYDVEVNLEEQKVHLDGSVEGLMEAVNVCLDVSGDRLDVDRILALLESMPAKAPKPRSKKAKSHPASASSGGRVLPPGLRASGEMKVGEVLYRGVKAKDVFLKYSFVKGVFSVRDFSSKVADGEMGGEFQADLNDPEISFKGDLQTEGLKVAALAASFSKGEIISGALESSMTFSGIGTRWSRLKNTLSANAAYILKDGVVGSNSVMESVSGLLGLEELRRIAFESFDGTLHVEKGRVLVKSTMKGEDVSARIQGYVGLDGKLDLPVSLTFSQKLTAKLQKKASIAGYLIGSEERAKLPIKLTGTVSRPVPTIEMKVVGRQMKESIQKRVLESLGRAISGKENEKKEKKPKEKPSIPSSFKRLMKGVPVNE
jgi:uncharacterized protein involved in outer membrane biogenesis